jgi:hypothetical protein
LIGLLRAILGLANVVARHIERRQLMAAGEAKMVASYLEATLVAVDRAMAARRSVDHSSDSVRDDPDNRDK